MKYLRFQLLAALLCLTTAGWAQRNVLRVDSVETPAGKTVTLPVVMENQSDIAGVQFDISVPFELVKDENDKPVVTLSKTRATSHQVSTRDMGTDWSYYSNINGNTVYYRKYRIMVFSSENSLFLDNEGTLLTVQMTMSPDLTDGQTCTVYLTNVTLSGLDLANKLSGTTNGVITIKEIPRPDLQPTDVTFTQSEVQPGGSLDVAWKVKNIGKAATEEGSGWSEEIALVNNAGTVSKVLTTTHYTGQLAAESEVSRSVQLSLPDLLGIDGITQVQVTIIPDANAGEHQTLRDNNTAKSASNLLVGKKLTLEITPDSLVENDYWQRITLKLTRSGNRNETQSFRVTATNSQGQPSTETRIPLPEIINIMENQSSAVLYLNVTDNDVLDADRVINLKIEPVNTASTYAPVTGRIIIEDNEYPKLTVTTSKTEVTEGEVFQLTVTTERASTSPIKVTLTSENTKRFHYPSTITIPAGELSKTVNVTAVDDDTANGTLTNQFMVSAPFHTKGYALVMISDNDMPVLELLLTPTTVQESDGPVCVAGVLKRTSNIDKKATVRISDDSNGALYFGNRTFTLDKGVKEVNFNFGPIDNQIVDGDRTYNIVAAVWLSSCSCDATGESAGHVTAQLTVLDNDGPALSLTSKSGTVKEGGTTTLTVTRNNATDEALTVTLTSDYDAELEYNHTVVIPAGQQSVEVEIKSKTNAVSGDSHTVVFTVAASTYASGTCWVMVTDQTLPDAVFKGISVNPTECLVGDRVTVTLQVGNEGNNASLPATTQIKIYEKGVSEALATCLLDQPLAVGATRTIEKTISLPANVGTHQLYAVINEANTVQELSVTNNTSVTVAVEVNSPFAATLTTDRDKYNLTDAVVFTGQLTGRDFADAELDLYIVCGKTRQVQRVRSDAEGNFEYRWALGSVFMGHCIAGVCYPDEGSKDQMAEFEVYGLRRTNTGYIKFEPTVGTQVNAAIELENPGVLPLTGVQVEVLSKPETYDFEVSIPATIQGGTKPVISYSFTANAPGTGSEWDQIKLKVTSSEGVELPITIYTYARMAVANLVTPNKRITTTMTKGQTREYPITLINNGQGATGQLTLALPDWIKCAQGSTLSGINKGDTATIVLLFKPTEEMQLNVPVTGTIGFNVQYGNGTYANFSVTPVSDQTGTLIVEVADEYTYYTDEKPHVKDAEVVVRNPVTNALVTQGKSGEDGLVTFADLPEGYYKISVTADNHDSYSNNILVDPGVTTYKTVNLSVEAVKVTWTVEETEVEDEYEIVTTMTYETNVPAPVVELVSPNRLPLDSLAVGESFVFYAIATNKGLINALNTDIQLPDTLDGEFAFEPLAENMGLTIAPQVSYILPVKVTRFSPEPNGVRRASRGGSSGCVSKVGTKYEWECGLDRKWNKVEKQFTYKVCPGGPGGGSPGGGGGGGGGGLGSPGGGGPGNGYSSTSHTSSVKSASDCSPCLDALGKWVTECVQNFIPVWGCTKGVYECANHEEGGASQAIDCTLTTVACAAELCGYAATATIVGAPVGVACEIVGWIANGLTCFKQFIPAGVKCWKSLTGQTSVRGLNGKRLAPVSEYSYINTLAEAAEPAEMQLQALYDFISEVMGDTIWVHNTTMEEVENLLAVVATYRNEQMDTTAMFKYQPAGITREQFKTFIERMNNTRLFDVDGIERENMIHTDTLQRAKNKIAEAEQMAVAKGYTSVEEWWSGALDEAYKKLTEQKSSVCSSISLQIKQTMTMTRQAFRGTLTVFNGHETEAMTDMRLDLVVSDKYNNVATAHEFQINAESLKNMTGELELDAGWTLAPNSEGSATVLFIPTKYAAPTEPVEYSFGGTLSYIDPYTGLEVTRELYPVTLTVKPSPELDLTYFMQRDLYGDDPLTEDIIEPTEPGEFALLINNKGYGDATNVRMTTMQPEIIENEKGLFIDFEIVSSQVNGGPAALSFGQTIANNLGDIPAHSQTYAQWWLQSSLLGHFTSYKVEATHLTSYGNEDLSLLDQVTIHELIHGFTPVLSTLNSQLSTPRAFLVNDVEDANDMPDQVYFTDATQQDVTVAQSTSSTKLSGYEYEITVLPSQEGWTYATMLDPTAGKQKLLKVVRKRDNLELPLDNVWQTSRSLRDGMEWLYENRLHFVGDMPALGETYLLTYEVRPDVELDFDLTQPEYDPQFLKEGLVTADVDEVTVTFNKPIQAETFTADDVVYQVQGEKQDLTNLTITPKVGVDNAYVIGLSALNASLPNGYYVLSVQGDGITDSDGFNGLYGRKVDWVLFRGGLIRFSAKPFPADGGNIAFVLLHENNQQQVRAAAPKLQPAGEVTSTKYGSTFCLTATPEEGYEFVNWTIGNEVVSTNPVYETTADGDLDIVANFKKKQFKIDMTTEGSGLLRGSGTGLYDYDTELTVIAEPEADFILKNWIIDGVVAETTSDTLTFVVKKATDVKAVFVRDVYNQTLTLSRGWNWTSTYLRESQTLGEVEQYANRVVSQVDELFLDPELGLIGGISAIEPGQAYKIEASARFSRTMRGHLFGNDSQAQFDVKRGWNWLSYPYFSNKKLSDVLADAEEGDYIVSQAGFSEYADDAWEGTLTELEPGQGYLYKSATEKQLVFDFETAHSVRMHSNGRLVANASTTSEVDIHRYPNTMNVTARICRDGIELNGEAYNIYAMAGNEMRGVSQFIGSNHYLTVYGDNPVEIGFVIESAESGEQFVANETLTFHSDVVGSRKSPFVLTIGGATGISQLGDTSRSMTIYTLEGVLVSRDATLKTLRRLPKGVYIVNGQKCYIR